MLSNQARQLILRILRPRQQFNLFGSQQCKLQMSRDVSSSSGGGVRGCGCSGVLGADLRPLKSRLLQLMSNYIIIHQHMTPSYVFIKYVVNIALVFGKLQCVDLVNWYIRSANMRRLLWDPPKSCRINSKVLQLLPLLLKRGYANLGQMNTSLN